eukprot:scaffold841_cov119-Skeletonema_menzelii.AAC.2
MSLCRCDVVIFWLVGEGGRIRKELFSIKREVSERARTRHQKRNTELPTDKRHAIKHFSKNSHSCTMVFKFLSKIVLPSLEKVSSIYN